MFVFAFVFVFALVLACVGDVGEGKLIVEEKEDGILYLDVVAVAGEGDDEGENANDQETASTVVINGIDVAQMHKQHQSHTATLDELELRLCQMQRASTRTIAVPTAQQWHSAVVGTDGLVYGIPSFATSVLIVDPETEAVDVTSIADLPSTDFKWTAGVLAKSGLIYAVPGNADSVLVINTEQQTADYTSIGVSDSRTGKWNGAVLGADNRVYGIPWQSPSVLIVDPTDNSVTYKTSFLPDGAKWVGGVLAPSGMIVGMPNYSNGVLFIDSRENKHGDAISVHFDRPAESKLPSMAFPTWNGAVLAPNGLVYGIPRQAASVLIVDPETRSIDATTLAGLSSSSWWGGVLGPTGRIYGIPLSSPSVLVIDPATNTMDVSSLSGLGSANDKWNGGVLASGKIFAVPLQSSSVLVVEPGCYPQVD